MKKTLRTMTLAGAGVLGSAAVAQAQPAPTAAPAAPPAQPPAPPAPAPPPVEFGVAPAALPSTPVTSVEPPPVVTFGSTPGADTVRLLPTEEKRQSPFYFSRLSWTNSASTQIFGVGKDFNGTEGEAYTMDFNLNLRYYFLNEPLDKAYVRADAGVTVELTNSNTDDKLREPLLKDTVVGAGYQRTLYKNLDGTLVTAPTVSASVVLPTSLASRAEGKYMSTTLSAGVIQGFPLAGVRSDWFPDLTLIGAVSWSHLFAKGYVPTNSIAAVQRPRQAPDGSEYSSDQLAMASFAQDKVSLRFIYYLNIYKDLALANEWSIQLPFTHQFPSTTVTTPTGSVPLGPSVTSMNPVTTFDVSLGYLLFNTVRVDLGYQNVTPELLDNGGGRRSVFYSTDALFYGAAVIYLDSIYDRFAAPPSKKQLATDSHFPRVPL